MSDAQQTPLVILSRAGSFLTPQPIAIDVSIGHGTPRMEVSMPLEGFVAEVIGALPHPTTLWTRAQVEAAIRAAVAATVVKLQHEVARVM